MAYFIMCQLQNMNWQAFEQDHSLETLFNISDISHWLDIFDQIWVKTLQLGSCNCFHIILQKGLTVAIDGACLVLYSDLLQVQ